MYAIRSYYAFAVAPVDINYVISPEFKSAGNSVAYIPLPKNEYDLPDYPEIEKLFNNITTLIKEKKIISAQTVKKGGIAAAVSKMTFGNSIGLDITANIDLFSTDIASFVVEIEDENLLPEHRYVLLGKTIVV